jgi:ribosomal protein uL23
LDPFDVVLYPLMTESASLMVEKENKLVFAVSLEANKLDIKRAIEQLYEVKVVAVNTEVTAKGTKKAFVKLHPSNRASDVAIKLGIL